MRVILPFESISVVALLTCSAFPMRCGLRTSMKSQLEMMIHRYSPGDFRKQKPRELRANFNTL